MLSQPAWVGSLYSIPLCDTAGFGPIASFRVGYLSRSTVTWRRDLMRPMIDGGPIGRIWHSTND